MSIQNIQKAIQGVENSGFVTQKDIETKILPQKGREWGPREEAAVFTFMQGVKNNTGRAMPLDEPTKNFAAQWIIDHPRKTAEQQFMGQAMLLPLQGTVSTVKHAGIGMIVGAGIGAIGAGIGVGAGVGAKLGVLGGPAGILAGAAVGAVVGLGVGLWYHATTSAFTAFEAFNGTTPEDPKDAE